MPIPPELSSKYSNEADFTNNFIIPLLQRMGYSVVVNYHGTQEFGKDLVFGEIDRFGHVQYHGLQAKYVGSVSQSDSHGLIEDCREAFMNPFMHPQTGSVERINSFYVVNGGSIPDNSRTNIFNAMQTPHGGHVRILDGPALISLDRLVARRRLDNVEQLLGGMRTECAYDITRSVSLKQQLTAKVENHEIPLPNERFRTFVLSMYLTSPLPTAEISTVNILNACHVMETANRLLDIATGFQGKGNRANIIEGVLAVQDRVLAMLAQIIKECGELQRSLGTLSSV